MGVSKVQAVFVDYPGHEVGDGGGSGANSGAGAPPSTITPPLSTQA
jgi:hypothetical protein